MTRNQTQDQQPTREPMRPRNRARKMRDGQHATTRTARQQRGSVRGQK